MPKPHRETTTRRAISEDPSLSPHANQLLTDELQAVIGADTADVPSTRPDHAGERHGRHSAFVADLISARIGLVVTAMVLLVVAAIVAAAAVGGVLVIVALVVVLLAATGVVTIVTLRLSGETEHVAPQTAAALEDEGIGDPDRVLTDLVKDFTTTREDGSNA